nr:uncharacterized protein LOC131275619 [Dasypus novemcinctus]
MILRRKNGLLTAGRTRELSVSNPSPEQDFQVPFIQSDMNIKKKFQMIQMMDVSQVKMAISAAKDDMKQLKCQLSTLMSTNYKLQGSWNTKHASGMNATYSFLRKRKNQGWWLRKSSTTNPGPGAAPLRNSSSGSSFPAGWTREGKRFIARSNNKEKGGKLKTVSPIQELEIYRMEAKERKMETVVGFRYQGQELNLEPRMREVSTQPLSHISSPKLVFLLFVYLLFLFCLLVFCCPM